MDSELTLRDYVQLLRRRLWVVVAIFIAMLTASLVFSALQTPMYASTARVLINQASAADIFESQVTQNTGNEVALIESQLVRDVAESRLGFRADISASVQTRADVISLRAEDPDAVVAQRIAQAYAEAYLDVRREQYIAERVDVAEQLLERIGQIDEEIEEASVDDAFRLQLLRDDLADQYDRLNISADLGGASNARIIDPAEAASAPFSPRVARNLVIGAALGLMLGVGAALLFESLDQSVSSREIIEATTPGVASVAVVPVLRAGSDMVTLTSPGGVESEAFVTMRAALEFAAIDESIRVLQITSAGASAGKTTIAANLAVAMAQAGQTVAVVDGDLRRPRLHELFGVDQVPGLTSAILGRETLNTAARELRLDNGRLRVYPSGPVPPGPAELLGSRRAGEVFDALKRSFDVLIIDSPPVLPVADALVLSRIADATLLVANARRTRRHDLQRSFESLSQAGANLVGTILNQASGPALYAYGYGYSYGKEETGFFARLFGGRSKYAPQRAGTQVLDRSELPKFQAARTNRRDGENGEAPGPTGVPVADVGRPRPAPSSMTHAGGPVDSGASTPPDRAPGVASKPPVDLAADGAELAPSWGDDIVVS